VDNEINLYKKIIIEEMIRPYFISTVPAVVAVVGMHLDIFLRGSQGTALKVSKLLCS